MDHGLRHFCWCTGNFCVPIKKCPLPLFCWEHVFFFLEQGCCHCCWCTANFCLLVHSQFLCPYEKMSPPPLLLGTCVSLEQRRCHCCRSTEYFCVPMKQGRAIDVGPQPIWVPMKKCPLPSHSFVWNVCLFSSKGAAIVVCPQTISVSL